MELVRLDLGDLKAEEMVLLLSPSGEVFALSITEEEYEIFKQLPSDSDSSILDNIANLICEENAIATKSPRMYLLHHGWMTYSRIQSQWKWHCEKKMTRRQLVVAKQIHNNESLYHLFQRNFSK